MSKDLKIGDKVFVSPFRQIAEVVAIKENEVQIHIGSLSFWKSISEVSLQDVTKKNQKSDSKILRNTTKKKPGASLRALSIDLHGLNQEEARRHVSEKISEGFLCGAEHLDIIHGLGTWKLRDTIMELLPTLGVGIEIREQPHNPGVLRVYFRR